MSKEISFFKYLKARKFEIIFVFFVIIIFSALLFGNNIDTKIVIYGIILSSILFIPKHFLPKSLKDAPE